MTITQITNHETQAEALLLEQFKERPRIKAVLLSYVRRVQELDDAIWSVLIQRLIDNAEGEQLDVLGRIVGQARADNDDETYRVYIRARIAINCSDGHADDIINVLRLVEPTAHHLYDSYPATVLISFVNETEVAPDVLYNLCRDAKGGGVRLLLTYGVDEEDAFSYCAGTAPESDTRRGFGLTDESTGGYLSKVFGT